ncbi:hypothetical protein L3Y34_012940 [Caenorhabditis briggsae]|uniref:Uncharacterized protein n=1 Tax=Caenorhabditis briggsae TaxID=6238 RepID=A0AAE8ZTX3_CAEBR|nr:hypothetical protein L3Y34_012940 [Caenorhabditis briggsae]
MRAKDKHFQYFPESIVESLIEFAIDVVGIYLPDYLLHGPVDSNHEFLSELTGSDNEKSMEINRRRNERETAANTMRKSISQMMVFQTTGLGYGVAESQPGKAPKTSLKTPKKTSIKSSIKNAEVLSRIVDKWKRGHQMI